MIRNRRVEVLLPEDLVRELDDVARSENLNRSGLIREATRRYLSDRRRAELRKQLRQGYLQMARINLELASDFDADSSETLEGE